MKKRFFYDEPAEFYWEVFPDQVYLTQQKDCVVIVAPHTCEDSEPDIDFRESEGKGAIFNEIMVFSPREFFRLADKIKKGLKK